jgi:hypothetical protein
MFLPGAEALLHSLLPVSAWHWLELLLATPVLLWAGQRFLVQGWTGLRHLAPGMNSLVMIGSSACRKDRAAGGAPIFPQHNSDLVTEKPARIKSRARCNAAFTPSQSSPARTSLIQ